LLLYLYCFFTVSEPRTEVVGELELFVDSASSINLTCSIISPDPPAYVFWKKEGKVNEKKVKLFFKNSILKCKTFENMLFGFVRVSSQPIQFPN
jgi:hypothetical protein